MNDLIREAFKKVKEDISQLRGQIISLTDQLKEFKRTFIPTDRQTNQQTDMQTQYSLSPTQNQTDQTDTRVINTKYPLGALKRSNSISSIGNDGVPTDRQTNRQTDKPTDKTLKNKESRDNLTKIERVAEMLSSLDIIKKELRTQFKRLTDQEMLVFSTIYQLEEEGFSVDYSLLAKKLNLSESSIRDYVQKLFRKSIPLAKSKENNKRVILSIPSEFKKIASLSTIISLREI